jgi:hypothetical protein
MYGTDKPDDQAGVDPDLERLTREIKSLRLKSDDIVRRMNTLTQKIEEMEEERRTRRENERKGN